MSRPKRKPAKNTPGARCHKCKRDTLCEKHHTGGVYQVVCPSCGYAAGKPYRKDKA